ncbi:HD-GYP domain-containing protein [Vallitalea okinawensis]|uniref:HD-GYP domain-containing protein n=1 Tax=Vallitalea okinawensis TaxID=2078660 RepID=UPI000CFC6393|nr:HD-GYP domain-containing protein [Vallitalea okinawensis]
MSKKLRAYIGLIYFLAILMLCYLGVRYDNLNYFDIILWGLLVTVTESFLIELPNRPVGVSVGTAISVVAIMVGGPLFAAIVTAIGFIFRMPYISGRGRIHLFNTPLYKTAFNVAQAIIINGVAGLLYLYFTKGQLEIYSLHILILVIFCYEIVNAIIMSGLFTLVTERSYVTLLKEHIKEICINSFGIGIIGIIIALSYMHYGYPAVILFFAPLLLARYTFKLYIDMRNIYIDTIQALNKALECKDTYTSGHTKRVEKYAVDLAKAMGMSEKQIQKVSTAALMHDIGKIGVPDNILNKASSLTKVEYEQIQSHPAIGANILSNVDFLKDIAEIIRCHHERADGKGYPNHLTQDQIPIESSILSIADVYDAMTSDRPYRKALSKEEAIKELIDNSGTQFVPELVDEFLKIIA